MKEYKERRLDKPQAAEIQESHSEGLLDILLQDGDEIIRRGDGACGDSVYDVQIIYHTLPYRRADEEYYP